MAAFSSFAAAEARAYAKVADHTWNNAFAQQVQTGAFAVRVQRYLSAATLTEPTQGGWVDITDDATT